MNVNNSNKKRIESKTGTKRNTIISLSQERTQNQDPIQVGNIRLRKQMPFTRNQM